MNKKIYFNNKFLEFFSGDIQPANNQPIKVYSKITPKDLKEIVSLFLDEKNDDLLKINIDFFDTVFEYLKKELSYIEAAGGLIKKDDKYLFIYRLDRWDLPKGKLDKGETIEHAAIRECEEECAVKNLTILKQLPSTFHIYPYKKNFAIKQSYWFSMQTDYNKPLIPQLEENITEVKWFTKKEIETIVLHNTYYTISDVVQEILN
jgi:ADP-ribose pyrophosphatase YjhB (NUDIX family)